MRQRQEIGLFWKNRPWSLPSADFIFIDCAEALNAEILNKFNIMVVPAMVSIDADGRECNRYIGVLSWDCLESKMTSRYG